ncbi:MAG: leucine-rich repeat domain-containing protein [Bacteroidaceae bacterium]|nr:leucine-rich repeat domain-containing protein [Bacteroidaceae bacterium]
MKYLRIFETTNERDQVLNMVPHGVISYVENIGIMIHSGIPNNEIHYKSSDGNIVRPASRIDTDEETGDSILIYDGPYNNIFGANIISNTYENGVGIITFDGNVTSIGNSAFYECTDLTSVAIPNSVTNISQNAFKNCINLRYVNIPEAVTSIGDGSFSYCISLNSVTLSNSVTTIGQEAFKNCWNLTSIVIPDSVTSIGNHAFWGCYKVSSIKIGSGVSGLTGIYDDDMDMCSAFVGCTGLSSIEVSPNNNNYDSRNNCNAIIETSTNKLYVGCKNTVIPNDVTNIMSYSFNGCFELTSITIPDSVERVYPNAFYYCTKLYDLTPDPIGFSMAEVIAINQEISVEQLYAYDEQVSSLGWPRYGLNGKYVYYGESFNDFEYVPASFVGVKLNHNGYTVTARQVLEKAYTIQKYLASNFDYDSMGSYLIFINRYYGIRIRNISTGTINLNMIVPTIGDDNSIETIDIDIKNSLVSSMIFNDNDGYWSGFDYMCGGNIYDIWNDYYVFPIERAEATGGNSPKTEELKEKLRNGYVLMIKKRLIDTVSDNGNSILFDDNSRENGDVMIGFSNGNNNYTTTLPDGNVAEIGGFPYNPEGISLTIFGRSMHYINDRTDKATNDMRKSFSKLMKGDFSGFSILDDIKIPVSAGQYDILNNLNRYMTLQIPEFAASENN